MSTFEPWYDARDALIDALERNLVGPSAPDEVLDDYPLDTYISGVLYPRYSRPSAVQDDANESEGRDTETSGDDAPVSMAHVKFPSSIGLTFAVDTDLETRLTVHCEAARYEAIEEDSEEQLAGSGAEVVATADQDAEDDDPEAERPSPTESFQRVPVHIAPIELDVSHPEQGTRKPLADGLSLFVRIRPADPDGAVTVTLAMVNDHELSSGYRDQWSFFQPRIAVTAASGASFPFIDKWSASSQLSDADLRSFRLLYRDTHHYATGHGCSVTWDEPGDPQAGIWTTFVPQVDLRLADSEPDVGDADLTMKFFAEGPRDDITASLTSLAGAYDDWIDNREGEIAVLGDAELQAIGRVHLDACRGTANRLRTGVELLRNDDLAFRSFQLANSAMLRQRARATWIDDGKPDGGPQEDERHRWRPFQIAFILQCLEGLTDKTHPERDLADLLWFPTGGGKTEAYLGLIAFTIFHRRLAEPERSAGVVALMRYTLRLLTIQQFQRAAMLICACESIRKERTDLGREPISVGLWVGGKGSPNTLSQAASTLRTLQGGGDVSEGNPIQLHACPWCGERLSTRNYYLNRDKTHLVIACKDESCEFATHLPVYVVDEEIYRDRPTLIIATVDKFASIAWREATQSLFNLDSADLPPDLIIQDELHLISGPLGTITGLYETAIDALCTQDDVRPKVVASTATIRRAGPQAAGLFNREVRQFPPPGLHASDSFFAVEAPPEQRPTRRYVGVMAPGSSHVTLMIRTYAALLQGATRIEDEAVRDAYWTLVGYFNSLRVLGGARIAVLDDVTHRIGLLAAAGDDEPRPVEQLIELTSREPSSAIPEHLEHMAVRVPEEDALDVILATNMISVGVDVDRLGLMTVMGQPQSSSEYIQATSRVGRQRPGLVVTILNAARSRDRSHFEGFVPFHRSIYRQVEATSVTPFAPRARDRALHAVYVALVRLMVPSMRGNDGAKLIANHIEDVGRVEELIMDRVAEVAPDEIPYVKDQLEEIRAFWIQRAEDVDLVYSNPQESHRALLVGADESVPETLPTLWSMRDVDQTSNLYLIG